MAQNADNTADRAGGPENAQQVRDDIDAGRTRDKVDHPDPATAPLGTDAEAGGARASVQPASSRRSGAPRPATARPWLIALVVSIVVNAGLVWFFAVWFFTDL